MSNALELQMRKVAIAFTVILVLLILWSAVRFALLSEPDAIAPAVSSLRVESVGYDATVAQEGNDDLTARPLFWQGRQRHIAVTGSDEPVVVEKKPDKSGLKDVHLVGVYVADGTQSGIILLNKGERQRLRLNESLGNWTFSMMSADGAIFESGDETTVLQLEHAVPKGQGKAQRKGRPKPAVNATKIDNKGE